MPNTSKGRGTAPPLHPIKRRDGFYFGWQVSLFRDRQGLKMAFKFKLLGFYCEPILFLRRNPNWGKADPTLTPKGVLVESEADAFFEKAIEPEDI